MILSAGEGIDHEPLLVGRDHFLRRRIEVEHRLSKNSTFWMNGILYLRPGVGHESLGLAELEHQRLLRLDAR